MPKTADIFSLEKAKASFKPIKNKYSKHLHTINEIFHQQLVSSDEKINQVSTWIKESPGKQFRPLFTLLVADAFGTINEEVLIYAASIEMIHNASLIHDDVLDDAPFRRGNATPHQLWGVKNALLLGDFLFSCGYRLVLKTSDSDCQRDLPNVASKMCESELLQSDTQFTDSPNLDRYYQIIDGKTASLFGISAGGGCRLSGGTKHQKDLMVQCGIYAGRAFQIMDDWLDFSRSGKSDNKPRGSDISNGTYTLPIILLLGYCTNQEKSALEEILFSRNESGINDPFIKDLCQKYKIADEVIHTAHEFILKAEELLIQATPQANINDLKIFLQGILVS